MEELQRKIHARPPLKKIMLQKPLRMKKILRKKL